MRHLAASDPGACAREASHGRGPATEERRRSNTAQNPNGVVDCWELRIVPYERRSSSAPHRALGADHSHALLGRWRRREDESRIRRRKSRVNPWQHPWPSRNCKRRAARSAVKVRRPRHSGGGAQRSTLYVAEHRSMLTGLMTMTIDSGNSLSNAVARTPNARSAFCLSCA